MFVLGHLGIGQALARPWLRALPLWPFFLGTLLPDLIDKPLYYLHSAMTGRSGLELGMFAGTRTVGHTLILTSLMALLGMWRRSQPMLALSLGMATHLLLDTISDFLGMATGQYNSPEAIPGYVAVVWPLLGTQFPNAQFASARGHIERLYNPVTVAGEVLGAALLIWSWHRSRARGAT